MRFWLMIDEDWAKQNRVMQQMLVLFLSALFLIFIYPKTGLDQRLMTPYFDGVNQQFSLKNAWILETVLHTGLKYCIIFVALGTLLAGFAGNIHAPLKPHQQALLWVFTVMMMSTSAVSLLKHHSIHGCPNDLLLYGGNLPYLQLFDALPTGVEMGYCFPGGHASGGFALMAFYFAFRDVQPKFAQSMLTLSLILGFAMGWAQMMRGEHFLSHNLWSAWVVWAICLTCQPLLLTQQIKRKVMQ